MTISWRSTFVTGLFRFQDISFGTATQSLLTDLEDEVMGTAMERRFFDYVRAFYEAVVEKMIAKFPFHDEILSDLAFLDPRKHTTVASTLPIIRLRKHFLSEDPNEIDEVVFCVAPYHQLPSFDPTEEAIAHFWAATCMLYVNQSMIYQSFPICKGTFGSPPL